MKHKHTDPDLADFHEATAHNPTAWRYAAETLLESAGAVKRGIEAARGPEVLKKHGYMNTHYATYGMLLGYAIECILKGLWVQKGNLLVEQGELIGVKGAGDHDLLQIALSVGVDLKPPEDNVLNRLSAFVRYAGRYPIPRTPAEWAPREVPGRGKVHPGFFSLEDFEIAERIANRLFPTLETREIRLE